MFIEKMMTYALGRGLEYYDMPAVRKIVRDARATNYRFSSIILGVARSVPFQMKELTPPAGGRNTATNDRGEADTPRPTNDLPTAARTASR